jgi:hypothetical protein
MQRVRGETALLENMSYRLLYTYYMASITSGEMADYYYYYY